MKCIVATHNPGKLKEIQFIFRDWPLEIVSMEEAGFKDLTFVEDGNSYAENALIKARSLAAHTDFAVISDDSGMEVMALHGAPGLYSARFGGEDLPFQEKRRLMLDLMKEQEDRRALFHSTVVLIIQEKEFIGEGEVLGVIAKEERGEHGFGFDAIFELADGRTFAEYPFEEKHAISHRFRAVQDLKRNVQNDQDLGLF